MWRFTILITVAVFGLVEASCNCKACPEYAVIEQHPDYEVRTYVPLTWATTSVSNIYRLDGLFTALRRFYRYTTGKNNQKQMMEMIVPWRMSSTKSGNETILKVDIMIASQFANDPPIPNDNSVKIVKEDATTYAVRTYMTPFYVDNLLLEAADKLAESVKNDDSVIRTSFFNVGYYSPKNIMNERHEIWMVKKVEQQTNEV